MQINLALLSARRFGLDLRKTDFDVGGIELPVMLIGEAGHGLTTVEAYPTTDGYFLAQIPVGNAEFTAGIQFGQLYDWVQVEDLVFYRVADLDYGKLGGPDGWAADALADGMTEMAPGLFQCTELGFAMVPTPQVREGSLVLSVVFRPVVERKTAAAAAQPAHEEAA